MVLSFSEMKLEELSKIKSLDEALEVIKLLLIENQRLKSENQELKERIAKLEKDSSTSSKPPSSDITKPEKERRRPGKRKRGGQKGHKGHFRKPVEPDKVEECHLEICPECGSKNLGEESPNQVKTHQQAELVIKPVELTEYRCFGRYCSCCNHVQYPELPSGVIPGQLFGPRLLSLCGYLKSTMGISITELGHIFTEVFQLPVARSTIQSAIFKVSSALAPCHDEALEALPKQKALNADETGWKEYGKKLWVWLFCTPILACFVIRDSRGCKVLKEILGETFDGALTSDFYSAYTCYATALQQFCLAHLIRDIKFLTTLPSQKDKDFGEKLLSYMRRVFKLWHDREGLSKEQFQKKVRLFETQAQNYVYAQKFEKGTDAHRIQRRLTKHWKSIFRFLKQPDTLQPTNNDAERDLRLLVRMRRVSQGSRGKKGQLWTARAATVITSCRKQKRSPWEFIQNAVNAHFFQVSAPSLVV